MTIPITAGTSSSNIPTTPKSGRNWPERSSFMTRPVMETVISVAKNSTICLVVHSVAVTDAASLVFAVEMIRAYPNAKVVLNVRRDLDAWHASAVENLVGVNEYRAFWFMSWWKREAFWTWHVYERLM